MSGATQELTRADQVFVYGAVTLFGVPFQALLLTVSVPRRGPTTPVEQAPPVWAVPRSLAATEGIASLSFPLHTEMFHFCRYYFAHLCIQCTMTGY